MTGHSMTTKNGRYEVVEQLRRPGGAVDLVVAYRKKGRGVTTTYTAFRHEPDGVWKAFNNAWSSAEKAMSEVARTDRYALVAAEWMVAFLAEAISADEPVSELAAHGGDDQTAGPTVRGGPELPADIEDEYQRGKDT